MKLYTHKEAKDIIETVGIEAVVIERWYSGKNPYCYLLINGKKYGRVKRNFMELYHYTQIDHPRQAINVAFFKLEESILRIP